MSAPRRVDELPSSKDDFWDGETAIHTPRPIAICETHGAKNYMKHTAYIDNHDGTVSCKFCPWGAMLPGYLRVLEGRLVDLRDLSN